MPNIGELSALAAALLWTFTSLVFSAMTKRIGVFQLNVSRLIMASGLLAFTFIIFHINIEATEEQVILLIISGIIGLIIGDTYLFKSYHIIGPRLGSLLLSSNPVFAAIIAFFLFSETLSFWAVTGITVTMAGIWLVLVDSSKPAQSIELEKGHKFRGVIFGLIAAICQAVGLIISKMAFNAGPIDGLVATFLRIFSSSIILVIIGIITKKMKNPFKLFIHDRKSFWGTLLGSIIGPYLGITMSFVAVTHAKVGIASTLMSLMPIFMLPLMIFIYKEKLSWKAITGAIAAVTGVALIFIF